MSADSAVALRSSASIVVIGGGALGLSVAYFLGKACLQTLLIAPRLDNGVASLAAGAMIDAFGEMDQVNTSLDRLRLDIKVKAQRDYPHWLDQLEAEADQPILRQGGMFLIGNQQGGNDRQQLAAVRQEMAGYGEPFETVAPEDVPGLCPHDRYPVYEALFLPGAMTVDSAQLLGAIEAAAQRNGYYQRLGDRVVSITPPEADNPLWQIQTAQGTAIEAEKVVVCAGAYSLQVLGEPLVQRLELPPLYFGLGSGCLLDRPPAIPHGIRTPNRPLAGGIHVVPRSGGSLYVGANNFFGTDLNTPFGTSLGDIHTLLENAMLQINRHFRQAHFHSAAWGLRPVTPSDQPLIGETQYPGLFLATGTHRTGVHYAPRFAQWIVAAVQGHPEPIAQPFAPLPQAIAALPPPTPSLLDGVKALVGSLLLPDGYLPYDRQQQLEQLLMVLLQRSASIGEDHPQNNPLSADFTPEIEACLRQIPNPKSALVELLNRVDSREK